MPRPINTQVIVITGASSGIGRAAALACGARGARVVLAARDEPALHEVARAIEAAGGQAVAVPTDVGRWEEVERLARTAVERFGRIDTWVNNAAISAYGTVEQMAIEEIERIVQVTLMGQIYGMKAALPSLLHQDEGTIINVASVLAERAMPLQAAYCAAKHGIKGFSEALRLELAHAGSHVAVTLILPAAIDTPFFAHARSRMGVQPRGMDILYEPQSVADAIVAAAERPQRDIVVGGAGKLLLLAQRLSPSLVDRLMLTGGAAFRQQQTDRPDDGRDNLFAPMPDSAAVTGAGDALIKRDSFYTRQIELHPARKRALLGLGLVAALLLARRWAA